jgi:hypothetical protein
MPSVSDKQMDPPFRNAIAHASDVIHRACAPVDEGGSDTRRSVVNNVSKYLANLLAVGSPISFHDVPACVP